MSIIMEDIAYLNDQLFKTNQELRYEISRLNGLLNAAYSLTDAQRKKIARLEAELNELRGVQSKSNAFDPSERVIVPTELPGTPVRGIVRGTGIGD